MTHFPNLTFAVADSRGSRYMLRIHRTGSGPPGTERDRARIESELWWLERLRLDFQLPVPEALRSRGGESVVSVDVAGMPEPRLSVLFRWMDGRFFRRGLRPAHLAQVGRLTARLHRAGAGLAVPSWFDRPRVDRADEAIEELAMRLLTDHGSTHGADLARSILRRAREAQAELDSSRNTWGLIHADIHQTNYLFHRGQVRLIDFDDCGWGHYLYDLAVTVHQTRKLPQGDALRAALLAGYREVRELPPAHEAMIDTFVALRELQDVVWDLAWAAKKRAC